MKSMRKIVVLLLVVILTLGLATTTFAAGSGKITVSGTTSGKVYDIYKIFDLTYSGDKVAYTIDSDWVNFFIGSSAPGKEYLLTAQPTGGKLNQLTYNKTTYYINITESNVAEFAQKALAWCADNTPAADKTATATGTSLVFSGLDLGYYLVYPQGATDIKSGNGSICSLTSTKPEDTVNVKATYPTFKKTGNKTGVEIGEVVTYTLTGQVPDTTGYTSYIYEFKDTMSKGLTFNDKVAKITVKFGSNAITVPDTTKGTTCTIANNGFDLKFDMTKYQDYKGQTITVTYQAVVNDDAVVQITENSATLTYSNDPQTPTKTTTTPPQDVQVYSSKIVIDKYDGADTTKKTKVQGAQFVLVKKSGSTESFYKYTAATSTADAKVTWVSDIKSATVVTTDANGAAAFNGLKDGTYYLRETKAPAGYNLLPNDVTVTVTHTTQSSKPIGVSVTSQVANNAGAVLPSTGSTGTTLFITFGSVLFMATMLVLVTKKRMYNAGF